MRLCSARAYLRAQSGEVPVAEPEGRHGRQFGSIGLGDLALSPFIPAGTLKVIRGQVKSSHRLLSMVRM